MLLHKMECHIQLNGYIIAKYFKFLNNFGKQHVHAKPIKLKNKKNKKNKHYYVCEQCSQAKICYEHIIKI